jgi:arylsulfatase
VDDQEVAKETMPHSIPFLMSIDETFDVGMDLRTPVDDQDYHVPFRFNGKIAKLTIKLEPEQLTASDRKVMQKHLVRAKD